jgi:hypothetical protein
MVDVIDAGQVHLFYTARLVGDFGAGAETLEAALFSEEEIPWDEIAFHSVRFALEQYLSDRAAGREGLHFLSIKHRLEVEPALGPDGLPVAR